MGIVDSLRDSFENKQKALLQGDQRIQDGQAATKASAIKASAASRRLSTTQLIAAACNTSNNLLVQSLWNAVQDYNTDWQPKFRMNSQQISHSVAVLDYIYQLCGTYMTQKSMRTVNSAGGAAKRKPRYDAFTILIQEVAREIESLGGRMLAGPADFRTKQANYWLERLDPFHRLGLKLSDQYDTWVKSGSSGSFWDSLKGYDPAHGHVQGYKTLVGVQWEHCYYFEADLLLKMENDETLSTANMSSAFSGKGWGVFVCSMPMRDYLNSKTGEYIFCNTHRTGYDHHSSFLAGAPVMAAGEWIVDTTGKIRVLTGKSGHYKPEWQNLHRFVRRFREIPGDAIIRPDMLDHNNGTGTIKYYRVSEFRSQQLRATPLRKSVVLGAIGAAGANTNFSETWPGNQKAFSDLLPP
jgi:hypothetical protein